MLFATTTKTPAALVVVVVVVFVWVDVFPYLNRVSITKNKTKIHHGRGNDDYQLKTCCILNIVTLHSLLTVKSAPQQKDTKNHKQPQSMMLLLLRLLLLLECHHDRRAEPGLKKNDSKKEVSRSM